ncbi:MAG: hypothetical protein QXJ17_06285 [Nitrososphaeria archaeon]
MDQDSRKAMFLALVFVSTVILILAFSFPNAFVNSPTRVLKGSLFVSDAGESRGGFEYNAEWNATLTLYGDEGVLKFVLNIGLGDALLKHEYKVSNVQITREKISMKVEGTPLEMIWVENDRIWGGQYDRHYIASWGGYAPSDEIRGIISPKIFEGLAEHYYVELRLK